MRDPAVKTFPVPMPDGWETECRHFQAQMTGLLLAGDDLLDPDTFASVSHPPGARIGEFSISSILLPGLVHF